MEKSCVWQKRTRETEGGLTEGDQEADHQEDRVRVLREKAHPGQENGQCHARIEKSLQPRVDHDHLLAEVPDRQFREGLDRQFREGLDRQFREGLDPQTLEDLAPKTSTIEDEQSAICIHH